MIDGSYDRVLFDDRVLHPAALRVRGTRDLVERVLQSLGTNRRLDQLIIWGHGGPGVQDVGPPMRGGKTTAVTGRLDDRVSNVLAIEHGHLRDRASLARLCGRFAAAATVDLHGCNVALHHAGRELIRQLADLWQVRVRAALTVQPSDRLDRYFGQVIEASPRRAHGARVHPVPLGLPAIAEPDVGILTRFPETFLGPLAEWAGKRPTQPSPTPAPPPVRSVLPARCAGAAGSPAHDD